MFRERELLVGSFGTAVPAPRQRPRPHPPPPVDRQLLAQREGAHARRIRRRSALEDLAAEVGLTTFQLIGLFKRTVGLTPHAYLTQVRLSMACRHLRHSPVLADVATAVGFYDQSALNKHFKRCYGITPTAVRARSRALPEPPLRAPSIFSDRNTAARLRQGSRRR